MNIQPLIEKIAREVERRALPGRPGAYRRYLDDGSNPYGCADAANILYTIGRVPRDPAYRAACVAELQKFQEPATGYFREEPQTHHLYHTAAHCAAALEIYDALPLYPMTALDGFRTPEGITRFLETMKDRARTAMYGHTGAGVFAALLLSGHHDPAWQDAYFGWLADRCDPEYGLGIPGISPEPRDITIELVHWFHFLFNFHACNRPIPHPEKMLDTCIDLFKSAEFQSRVNCKCQFIEIDWCFCMNRASRQTSHRFAEVRELLREEMRLIVDFLTSKPEIEDLPCGNDLHTIFGMTCALSELQLALPGEIKTDVALRNVLDRRPFI